MESNTNIISMVVRPVARIQSEPRAAGFTISLGRKVLEASILQGHRTVSDEALGMPRPLAKNKDGSLKFSKLGELTYATNREFTRAMQAVKANVDAILLSGAEEVFATHVDEKKVLDASIIAAAMPIFEADKKLVADTIAAQKAAAEKAELDKLLAAEAVANAKKEAERVAAMEAELETLRAEKAVAAATQPRSPIPSPNKVRKSNPFPAELPRRNSPPSPSASPEAINSYNRPIPRRMGSNPYS